MYRVTSNVIGWSASWLPVWIDVSDCPVDIRYLVGEGFGSYRQDNMKGFALMSDALAYACQLVGN